MRLSEERIAHLTRQISDELLDEEHVDLEINEDLFLHLIDSKFTEVLRIEDEIDEAAAAWMHQHKPNLEDGSHEFQIELDRVKKTLAEQRGYLLF